MSYLAKNEYIYTDIDGWNGETEVIFNSMPYRSADSKYGIKRWMQYDYNHLGTPLPNGSIKKLIGRELTFNDEPVKI